MSASPAARLRAGIKLAFRNALPAVILLLAGNISHAADTQAQTILAKMMALYQKATTYQGTITIEQGGSTRDGKAFSVSLIREISFKSPNKLRMQLKYANGTGAAAKANGQTQLTVSDGKSALQYIAAQKVYAKGPAQPTLPAPFPATLKIDMTTAKMLPATTVAGRPVYEIEAQGQMPPNVPANQLAQAKAALTWKFDIDKSNNYLLRFTPGKQKPILLSNQTINGSIPDSQFTFTPPPGAKLYTPPSAPAGAPGAAPQGAPMPGAPTKKN